MGVIKENTASLGYGLRLKTKLGLYNNPAPENCV